MHDVITNVIRIQDQGTASASIGSCLGRCLRLSKYEEDAVGSRCTFSALYVELLRLVMLRGCSASILDFNGVRHNHH
jgi:hypothetical protein